MENFKKLLVVLPLVLAMLFTVVPVAANPSETDTKYIFKDDLYHYPKGMVLTKDDVEYVTTNKDGVISALIKDDKRVVTVTIEKAPEKLVDTKLWGLVVIVEENDEIDAAFTNTTTTKVAPSNVANLPATSAASKFALKLSPATLDTFGVAKNTLGLDLKLESYEAVQDKDEANMLPIWAAVKTSENAGSYKALNNGLPIAWEKASNYTVTGFMKGKNAVQTLPALAGYVSSNSQINDVEKVLTNVKVPKTLTIEGAEDKYLVKESQFRAIKAGEEYTADYLDKIFGLEYKDGKATYRGQETTYEVIEFTGDSGIPGDESDNGPVEDPEGRVSKPSEVAITYNSNNLNYVTVDHKLNGITVKDLEAFEASLVKDGVVLSTITMTEIGRNHEGLKDLSVFTQGFSPTGKKDTIEENPEWGGIFTQQDFIEEGTTLVDKEATHIRYNYKINGVAYTVDYEIELAYDKPIDREEEAVSEITKESATMQNFNTYKGEAYYGVNAGWKLSDDLNFDDIDKIEVKLYHGENVLVTNTAVLEKHAELYNSGTREFSTPFAFESFEDGYWEFGEWNPDKSQKPTKVELIITGKLEDNVVAFTNDSLADVVGMEWDSLFPSEISEELKAAKDAVVIAMATFKGGERDENGIQVGAIPIAARTLSKATDLLTKSYVPLELADNIRYSSDPIDFKGFEKGQEAKITFKLWVDGTESEFVEIPVLFKMTN